MVITPQEVIYFCTQSNLPPFLAHFSQFCGVARGGTGIRNLWLWLNFSFYRLTICLPRGHRRRSALEMQGVDRVQRTHPHNWEKLLDESRHTVRFLKVPSHVNVYGNIQAQVLGVCVVY